jgi:microcystin-dependent protein
MATLTIPYSFNPNTAIVASEVNTNFGAIKTFVEALAAGTNIDSAAITTDKLATNTIQLLTPTGSITQYGGSAAPTGWLLCDGSAISRTTYAALFSVIGTTFGTGDGSTTFNVPDLKGRVPVGRNAADVAFDVLGESGGAKTHTLTSAEMPIHRHNVSAYSHSVSQSNALTTHSHTADGDLTAVAVGNHSHTADGNLSAVGVGDHTHTGTSDFGGFHDHTIPTRNTTSTSHTHQSGTRVSVGASAANETDTSRNTDYASSHQHTFTSNGAGTHSHDVSGSTSDAGTHGHDVSGSTSAVDLAHGHSVGVGDHAAKDTTDTGSGGAHNNLQPYLVVNYIIKI